MGLTIDDQLAIQQLAARYNHAIDSGDSTGFAGAFVESGVPLESRISRDILISIFQPGLPLHDGAVTSAGRHGLGGPGEAV